MKYCWNCFLGKQNKYHKKHSLESSLQIVGLMDDRKIYIQSDISKSNLCLLDNSERQCLIGNLIWATSGEADRRISHEKEGWGMNQQLEMKFNHH